MDNANKRRRERYALDPDFRDQLLARNRAYRAANRDKVNAKQRQRYAADAEFRASKLTRKSKETHLKQRCTRHGISLQEFDALLRHQNYACGICERPFRSTPCIDHCHVTRLVRGLLCGKCNLGLGHFQDNPAFLVKAARYMARWRLHVLQILDRKENDMMTTDDSGDGKASRVMRNAILHELHQPFGVDEPPPADKLQAVARALVTKAVAHDISAIKEILERIDGKTASAPANNDLRQLANLSWKQPERPGKMPASKLRAPKKSKSTTGRAPNSSRSTDEPSVPPCA